MKLLAISALLLAPFVYANPAPAATADSSVFDMIAQWDSAVSARDVAAPAAVAAPNFHIFGRATKKPKGSSGSQNETESAAVGFVSPSRALQVGAVGLGVMEVVRLWG
jgi:ketosteroid isomerase-like protein